MFQKLKNIYHFLTAWSFQAIYGFPSKKLKIIGITGTDGKTTTSSMVYHVLKSAGKKVSVITSVAATIGGKNLDTGFHVTTPDPQDIPKYMSESVKKGDEFFVFEITSHGLDQHRAAGVRFEISGITNITHEHLGYHKTYGDYVAAKAKIANLSKKVIVNSDQKGLVEDVRKFAPKANIKTFGYYSNADYSRDISQFVTKIYLEQFNKYNALLAYSICRELGITDSEFDAALDSFAFPPGRMEEVYKGDIVVISDFAHTPNALSECLPAAVKKYKDINRLIHVFGAAAFRDDSKRADMGLASGSHANVVILTEEDYRTENPQRIFSMLAAGLEGKGFSEIHPSAVPTGIPNKSYMKILNRDEAIKKAVEISMRGDVIVITGKAQEGSLCRGKVEYPYNEKNSIKEALRAKGINIA